MPFGIKSIAIIAANLWNKISNKIKEVSFPTFFKVKLKNGFRRIALVDFAKHVRRVGFIGLTC